MNQGPVPQHTQLGKWQGTVQMGHSAKSKREVSCNLSGPPKLVKKLKCLELLTQSMV